MGSPLLSIVVPTKDRYPYLKHLIKLIDSFQSDEIELVIQDNSDDNNDFSNYLESAPKEFIHYFYQKGQIPMSKNSDLAILHSNGEYVCFIGDDDGVTIDIIDCVRYMKREGVEALRSVSASYCWPEVGRNRFVQMGGRVDYDVPSGKIENIEPLKALDDIVKKGFINRGQLPLVYHGIVSRKALDRVYAIGGTYFPGCSPDISNGVALSLVVGDYKMYNKIVTFSGSSKYHGGGVYTSGKKHPELSDIKWFLPGAVENWDDRLPKIGEGDPIWCDSAIKALRYMGRDDLEKIINFENLYVHFALSHKDLIGMSLSLTKNKLKFYFLFLIRLGVRYYNGIKEWIYGKFNKLPGRKSDVGFNDVAEAADYFHTLNCKYNKI